MEKPAAVGIHSLCGLRRSVDLRVVESHQQQVEKGGQMIGYIVKNKVKRFTRTRKRGILVSKVFLEALDQEIERVLVASVENCGGNVVNRLAADTPRKKITDRLVCDVRIKERARKINKDAVVSKKFLTNINTYAGAIIITSLEMVKGAYIKQLVAGNATAKVVAKKQAEADPPAAPTSSHHTAGVDTGSAASNEKDAQFEPALPREHVRVTYSVCVQQAILTGTILVFTAKTTERIKKVVLGMVHRHLESLGIADPITIEILKVERKREKYA